jgi:hypothetical protein
MDRHDQRDPNLLLKYFPIVLTQADAPKTYFSESRSPTVSIPWNAKLQYLSSGIGSL